MAAINLSSAGRVEVVQSHDQLTLSAGVAVTAGAPIYSDANGNWALATSADAAHSTGVYIAAKACQKGEALTGVRAGIMDGYDLSGLAYNASLFMQDAGGLGTTAGTVSVVVGRVLPAIANSFSTGSGRDKIARISCPL